MGQYVSKKKTYHFCRNAVALCWCFAEDCIVCEWAWTFWLKNSLKFEINDYSKVIENWVWLSVWPGWQNIISSPNFFTSCPKSSHHISELLFVSKPRTFEKANLITLLALKFKNRLYRLCACDVDTLSDSYLKFFSKWSSQCKIAILNFIIFRTFDAWKDNKKHMFESQSQCQCLKKSTKLLKFSFKRIFNCGCQMWRGILNCTFYFFAQKVLF